MAELWKNLIAQEDPALAEMLELSRVSISKKTGGQQHIEMPADYGLYSTSSREIRDLRRSFFVCTSGKKLAFL